MAGSELGFIIFYVAFFTTVLALGSFGVDITGSDVNTPPVLDGDDLTLLSFLVFVFDVAIYFLTLQGLTLFGVSIAVSAVLSLVLNVGFIYVVARLVRGGG